MKEKLTDPIKIMTGVLQGETLSPTLFSLFLNDIVSQLDAEKLTGIQIGKLQVKLLLYADDKVLVASNAPDLQRLINKMAAVFKEKELQVNLTKTKIVVFRKAGQVPAGMKFTWENESIEIVNQYTYLGVPFYWNGRFGVAKKHFFEKAKIARGQLKTLLWRSRTSDVKIQHKLFMALLTSILLYGQPIWGMKWTEEVEKLQTSFLVRGLV